MTFKLEFEADNAAFAADYGKESAGILLGVAARIKAGSRAGQIRDSNGNRIGRFEFTPIKQDQ